MTSITYTLPPLPLGSAPVWLVRWLAQPGDTLAADTPLLVVVNNTAEMALPGPAGTLAALLAEAGSTLDTDTPLAEITPPVQVRATPLARNIAASHDLALGDLAGSGDRGRITRRDVLGALPNEQKSSPVPDAVVHHHDSPGSVQPAAAKPNPPAASPAVFASTPLPAALPTLAAPYALTVHQIDMADTLAFVERQRPTFAARGLPLDPALCLAAAAAEALLRFPLLNSTLHGDYIARRHRLHLALATPDGAFIIPNAQDRNLRGFARALRPANASIPQATFRVSYGTNLMQNTPPSGYGAALHASTATMQPTVGADGSSIVARPISTLSLVYDARILDQHHADQFLQSLRSRLVHQANGQR